MKILFLTRWFPPYGGMFMVRHARAVALYHKLTVLAVIPGDPPPGGGPLVGPLPGDPACKVIRFFYPPSKCRIAFLAGMINLLRFFSRTVAGYRYAVKHQGPFDILHAHILTRTAILPFLLNLLTGKPYIISEHWTRYIRGNWGFTGIVRRAVTRLVVRRAAAVTTVSGFLKSAMEDCGLRNRRFTVIPNALDTEIFTIGGKRTALARKKILHVSNLHERAKNIHGMLRVIRKLQEQRQDFEVLFAGGDEPDLTEAGTYAECLGLVSPVVTFRGRVTPEELSSIYRESSFLLMFSNFETFSVVIPEALSCGIPVLATAVGGIPEYFSDRAGRLTPPGDEALLLENLNYMLDHCTSYEPEILRGTVEMKFSLKIVGKLFDDLYRSVAGFHGNASG
jgi:glycosyltransferase involved in cell wall biosynthesis